jgi:uncharacterized protein (TIGR02001 family)
MQCIKFGVGLLIMTTFFKIQHCVALASMLFATSAVADGPAPGGSLKDTTAAAVTEAREFKMTYNIGATSDYIFRGFSQTRRNPAIQGGVDATYGIAYAGLWASNTNWKTGTDAAGLPVRADVELDVYAGIKPVLKTRMGDYTFDFGAIYYTYPGAGRESANPNYFELKAGVSKEIWKDGTLSSTYYYSPEYQFRTGAVWTSETAFTQTLTAYGKLVPSVSALIGYQKGNKSDYSISFANGEKSYVYWNAGATFTYDEKWSLDLRYWDTTLKDNNLNGGGPGIGANSFCSGTVFQCTGRAMATVKYTF